MTAKEMRQLFEWSEDEEEVLLVLANKKGGKIRSYLECTGAYSTSGGRMTILEFVPEKSNDK